MSRSDHHDEDEHEGPIAPVVVPAARAEPSLWAFWDWLLVGGTQNIIAWSGTVMLVPLVVVLILHDAFAWRHNAGVAHEILAASPHRARQERLGDSAVFYRVGGRDAQGRGALFDLIVMGRRTVWVRGRADQVAREGQLLSAEDFKTRVIDMEVGRHLTGARELVAVGVASAEGTRSLEEARAGERARRIAGWLEEAVGGKRPIWLLNLGQHDGLCPACDSDVTDWQRPIIIIALEREEPGVDLEAALRSAFQRTANLPEPESYSRFELTPY